MAKDLLATNTVFYKKMEECSSVVEQRYGLDLITPFRSGADWPGACEASVALTALQIGLVNVLAEHFGIKPAGFLGHSAGESGINVMQRVLGHFSVVLAEKARLFYVTSIWVRRALHGETLATHS
jgi:acyl transferase domain-containing protein